MLAVDLNGFVILKCGGRSHAFHASSLESVTVTSDPSSSEYQLILNFKSGDYRRVEDDKPTPEKFETFQRYFKELSGLICAE